MRLIELEITNVRGIPHVVLKPDRKNFVIWGPNGSGKSAVVDAIDFLLTGRISRLMGEGTGGIKLADHGPHIGSAPADARVKALIQVPGLDEPIQIERSMAKPNALRSPVKAKAQLDAVLEVAKRGQHVLTRREILRYITSDASTRAQQIQHLLNVSEIEEIRRALVHVQNDANREVSATKTEVSQAKGTVNATTQQTTYQPELVLALVNQCRGVLGGLPLQDLSSRTLKDGLGATITRHQDNTPSVAIVGRDTQNLLNCLNPEFQASMISAEASLRSILTKIHSDKEFSRVLSQAELVEKGIKLIDESGACPLCDTEWIPGKLQEHLEEKLSRAEVAKAYRDQVTASSSRITESVSSMIESLKRLISAIQQTGEQLDLVALRDWLAKLEGLIENLRSPVEKYVLALNISFLDVIAPSNMKDILEHVLAVNESNTSSVTPEQAAWDTLTRLEENMKRLENAEKRFTEVDIWNTRASLLLDSFQGARDSVLADLYDSIRDRFVSLYRKLHDTDESEFIAKLEPDGAGLSLEVDFYGRGTHPPNALHSEGHQDSMGVCLYLALSERLTHGIIDLVILDDVVMSVDADHRRQLCSVIASEFSDKQFLITTHDRNWARQLRSESVVTSKNSIEFFNWNVDTGPQVNHEVDIWSRIDADLKRGDVPSAAAKLRRGMEEYLSTICDALLAKVPFKLSGRYELGELIQSAMHRYKELLGKAKRSAQSWGDTGRVESLQEIESVSASVFKRTNAEQWAVNPNVHYNQWINFSSNDFAPVRDAFHDLFDIFQCSHCGSVLRVLTDGLEDAVAKCTCDKIHWNLVLKPKG